MNTLDKLLHQYSQSHQNPINKRLHWICVPAIFVSILAMLYHTSPALAYCGTVLVIAYYARLSLALALGMGLFMVAVFWGVSVCPFGFMVYLGIFALAWVGQFVGHHIEGKKPSFFEDLQFLLIGPAWVAKTLGAKLLRRPKTPQPAQSH